MWDLSLTQNCDHLKLRCYVWLDSNYAFLFPPGNQFNWGPRNTMNYLYLLFNVYSRELKTAE